MLIPLNQVDNIFNPPCTISTSGMTSRHQGKWSVLIQSNQVKSTTFSNCHQSPVTLYSPSLKQIDFRHDKSTLRDVISIDSIKSSRIDIFNPPWMPRCTIFSKSCANQLPVWRIDTKGDNMCRFHQIELNWQNFQPTIKAQFCCILYVLPVWRIYTHQERKCGFNRIKSNWQHFQSTLKAHIRYIF